MKVMKAKYNEKTFIVAVGRAFWLLSQPRRSDGCIYKPPGFHGHRRNTKSK
jgi:hypothetical protein